MDAQESASSIRVWCMRNLTSGMAVDIGAVMQSSSCRLVTSLLITRAGRLSESSAPITGAVVVPVDVSSECAGHGSVLGQVKLAKRRSASRSS